MKTEVLDAIAGSVSVLVMTVVLGVFAFLLARSVLRRERSSLRS